MDFWNEWLERIPWFSLFFPFTKIKKNSLDFFPSIICDDPRIHAKVIYSEFVFVDVNHWRLSSILPEDILPFNFESALNYGSHYCLRWKWLVLWNDSFLAFPHFSPTCESIISHIYDVTFNNQYEPAQYFIFSPGKVLEYLAILCGTKRVKFENM